MGRQRSTPCGTGQWKNIDDQLNTIQCYSWWIDHWFFCLGRPGGSLTSLCPTLPNWDRTLSMWKKTTSTTGAPVASPAHSHGVTMWVVRVPSSSRWLWFQVNLETNGFVEASTALQSQSSMALAGLYGWMSILSQRLDSFSRCPLPREFFSLGWPIHKMRKPITERIYRPWIETNLFLEANSSSCWIRKYIKVYKVQSNE